MRTSVLLLVLAACATEAPALLPADQAPPLADITVDAPATAMPGDSVLVAVTLPLSAPASGVNVFLPITDAANLTPICPALLAGECLGITGNLSVVGPTVAIDRQVSFSYDIPASFSGDTLELQVVVPRPGQTYLSLPVVIDIAHCEDLDSDGSCLDPQDIAGLWTGDLTDGTGVPQEMLLAVYDDGLVASTPMGQSFLYSDTDPTCRVDLTVAGFSQWSYALDESGDFPVSCGGGGAVDVDYDELTDTLDYTTLGASAPLVRTTTAAVSAGLYTGTFHESFLSYEGFYLLEEAPDGSGVVGRSYYRGGSVVCSGALTLNTSDVLSMSLTENIDVGSGCASIISVTTTALPATDQLIASFSAATATLDLVEPYDLVAGGWTGVTNFGQNIALDFTGGSEAANAGSWSDGTGCIAELLPVSFDGLTMTVFVDVVAGGCGDVEVAFTYDPRLDTLSMVDTQLGGTGFTGEWARP
jgi:hypothetical protein